MLAGSEVAKPQASYWIVDPETDAVEVWDFAAAAREPARHSKELPVRLGGKAYGAIELSAIFPPEL